MKKLLALLVVFTCLINLAVNAQVKIKKGEKNNAAPTFKLPADYAMAENLAKEAIAKLNAGETKAADSLIKKAIATYPVYAVMDYAKELMLLPDVVGANLVMAQLKEKVTGMEGKILLTGTIQLMMANGNAPKPEEYEKERAYYHVLNWIYTLNRTYASRPYILESLADFSLPKIVEDKNAIGGLDFEHYQQQAYKTTEALYLGDYQKARAITEASPISAFNTKELKMMYLTNIDILEGNYKKGIENALELAKSPSYKPVSDVLLFSLYGMLGDDKALDYYNLIDTKVKENNYFYYRLALFYLAKQDYPTALKNIEKSNSLRKEKIMIADMLVEGWDFYNTYGEILAGLKEYEKARDNFNIALIYYPGYKKAIASLARMEASAGKIVVTDKTAPIISITEPTPSRGLTVVSAMANVMVKGNAKDVSGIKEVTINGAKIYAQPDGNFWGDVPMKTGINKIIVVAVDNAGNRAEKSFDIEKVQPSAPNAPTPIIAVAEKESKNYCLLIAAQNYLDTSIPSLNNPVADAIKLKVILKRDYGFQPDNVISLFNPTTGDIKRQLLELTNTIQPQDNLVIFYAGHGIWNEKEKKGYWLMTDAQYKDTKTWLPNKEVLDLVAKLPARHTLLITDACFSGSVFKTRGIPASAPSAIKELDNKISRVAITSGNDTEVPDESVFMKYLVKALSENKEKYLTAQKMFINQIMEAVMTETKTEPRYGTLELAGHVGGDFIFTKN